MITNRGKSITALAPLMTLAALVLYAGTLSRGPFPGESASLMAAELGLTPFAAGTHPLWSWLVDMVSRLPGGTVSLRLNLMSAVCAAAAVGVFARLLADVVWGVIPVNGVNVRAANRASWLAGLAGAVALAGCVPFWYAANRFHPASFDLLVLFSLAALLISFFRRARVWTGLVFAFLYGLLAVEFATLIVFGPLVLVALLYALWLNGDLRWGRIAPLALGLVAGMLFYLPAALHLRATPAFQLGDGGGFGMALFLIFKGQYLLIAKSLPQIGWLLVILVGIVPWLAILMVGRRGLNEEKDWGLVILHVILTAVVVAVFFNVPFSPWRLLGPWRLLVTPYALLAFCLGYLTAYWSLFSRLFWQTADEEDPRGRWLREYGGLIPAVLLLATALAAGVINFAQADARPAGLVNAYARSVVSVASDREWLVTDGVLDSNYQIAAREMGVPLKCLNLQNGNNLVYMRSIARLFPDVRLRSLAEVDVVAFLRQWMESEPRFAEKVAFLSLPDMWYAATLQPVPDRVLFRGVKAVADLDPGALWDSHVKFWSGPVVRELAALRDSAPLLGGVATALSRHLGMVANNLGVVLEDAGWRQQAYSAYAKARELDPANVSALLNQLTMVTRGYAAPDADTVKKDFAEFTKNLKQKMQIWSLSRVCGYVRMPEAYANLGMTWAFSGQPGLAVAGYKRAIELAPDRKDQLSCGLALAYLAQDQVEQGGEILRQLLDKDPGNAKLLLSVARLAAQQNRFDEAATFLERAQKAGVSKDRIAMEYAVLHVAAGEPAKARVILQELVDLNPQRIPAWAMLAAVLLQQNDLKALEECERRLGRAKNQDFLTTVMLGEIALRRAKLVEARTYFDQALGMRPGTAVLLEMLLRLDVQEGRRDLAGAHVRSLLLLDPGHPFANQILASMQLERKQYTQAENSLRKSLERKSDPLVMNDLAWVLQEKGELDEAESMVRAALKLDDKAGVAWDTLAMILMKRGRLPEAGEFFRKALSLAPNNFSVQVHLVTYYGRTGEEAKAVDLAENLLANPARLSPDEQDALRRVIRRTGSR